MDESFAMIEINNMHLENRSGDFPFHTIPFMLHALLHSFILFVCVCVYLYLLNV